jgi:hypothetical protein
VSSFGIHPEIVGQKSFTRGSSRSEGRPNKSTTGQETWINLAPSTGRLAGAKTLHNPILAPLITLVLWTFVMWAWLYATRIPAIRKNKIVLDPQRTKEEFNAQIPPKIRWKADNYNHLMEQPTLFYAVTLTLALVDTGSSLNTGLAWLYVGLRIAHSLVQAIINVIILRFTLFMAASLVLLALTIRAAFLVF